jgi:hypothetical protein
MESAVVAPPPSVHDSVDDWPLAIAVGLAVKAEIIGAASTFTVTVAVADPATLAAVNL